MLIVRHADVAYSANRLRAEMGKAVSQMERLMLKKIRLLFRALAIHIVNTFSNLLPSDVLSSRFRPHLFKLLGCQFGEKVNILGGVTVLGGNIRFGSYVFVNRNCYFDLSASVYIGSNVVIGHHVKFITADHQLGSSLRRCGVVLPRPIFIGDGVWIGANVIILPGVSVGAGSVIAAGSVVKSSIAENVLAAGVPATERRKL